LVSEIGSGKVALKKAVNIHRNLASKTKHTLYCYYQHCSLDPISSTNDVTNEKEGEIVERLVKC